MRSVASAKEALLFATSIGARHALLPFPPRGPLPRSPDSFACSRKRKGTRLISISTYFPYPLPGLSWSTTCSHTSRLPHHSLPHLQNPPLPLPASSAETAAGDEQHQRAAIRGGDGVEGASTLQEQGKIEAEGGAGYEKCTHWNRSGIGEPKTHSALSGSAGGAECSILKHGGCYPLI